MKTIIQIILLTAFVLVITMPFGRSQAQTKPAEVAATKPEKTAIEFTASDAAKIARIQAKAETVCGEARATSYTDLNKILQSYNIPGEGWEITIVDGNWVGAHKSEAKVEKKP